MNDRIEARRAYLEIGAISFVILFQELALIRWLPTQVRVLSYFPNVVLISAFLGLGIGCLLASRRPLVELWPLGLVGTGFAAWGMSGIAFTQESVNEHLWLLYHDLAERGAPVVNDVKLPIVACFVLSATCFVPLGQMLASRIAAMGREDRSLPAYSFDLFGSLAGTAAFTLFSFLRTPPIAWFAAVFIAGLVFMFRTGLRRVAVYVACGCAMLFIAHATNRAVIFSPYYALGLGTYEGHDGRLVLTNGSIHQYAAPMKPSPGKSVEDTKIATAYLSPYGNLRKPPEKVLVLGAGTGNDVATALLAGAKKVDAVEIDPDIIELGRTIHPDRPYADSRVSVINDDARSYLNRTTETYDLVVFGTLDSMTRLSALSSVRLDNFVYTRECLESVRQILRPGGGVIMYFMVSSPFIFDRIAKLHDEAFGEPPIVLNAPNRLFNRVFFSGDAFSHLRTNDPAVWGPIRRALASTEPSTDDWPYLYLRTRGVSSFYLTMIAILVALSAAAVFGASKELRDSIRAGRADVEMICLGAAFLLLETKSVTEMNLAWGATWLTNAVVFASILTMLLASTLLMQRKPIPARASIAGLVVTLLGAYAAPTGLLPGLDTPIKLACSLLVVGLPIFFAASLFAVRFRARSEAGVALGWNLLGAVIGGLLEFTSMAIGIRNLALLAIVLYLVSALARQRTEQAEAAGQGR
jgi:spermidine synthase